MNGITNPFICQNVLPHTKWQNVAIAGRTNSRTNCQQNRIAISPSKGLFGTMTGVQSDDYPVAAHAIKDLFCLNPKAATSPAVFPPENVMLQLPSKIDKESKANKASSS
jgi:hypothetical protein